ncbi:MAG: transporter [Candidatus Omnitrophica bacterium]|nr:transporter [Candidatus Omnitrophota bacterium]
MPFRIMLFVVIICLSLARNIFCDEEVKKEPDWNPYSVGPVAGWTAPVCEKGQLIAQPFYFYNHTRGTFDSQGNYNSLGGENRKNQMVEQFCLQYGITDHLEIKAQMAYQQNQLKQDGQTAYSKGFADSYAFLRYCMIEESGFLPHLSLMYQLRIPTGKFQKADPDKLGTDLMGNGSYDNGIGVILTKKFKPWVIHFDGVYNVPSVAKVDGIKIKNSPYLNLDFAVEYFLPKGFNLMLELNGYLQGDKREAGIKLESSDTNYLIVCPAVGWSNEKIQTLLAYQRTAVGTNTDANDSVVLTFLYSF